MEAGREAGTEETGQTGGHNLLSSDSDLEKHIDEVKLIVLEASCDKQGKEEGGVPVRVVSLDRELAGGGSVTLES